MGVGAEGAAPETPINWLDIVIVIGLVLLAILGWRMGIIRAVFMVGGIVVAALLGARISGPVSRWVSGSVQNSSIVTVVVYVIVAVIMFVLMALIGRVARRLLSALFLGWLDGVAGAVLGLTTGVLLGAVLIAVLARLAFLVPTSDVAGIAPVPAREGIKGTLVGSRAVGVYLSARDAVPDAPGFISTDLDRALDELSRARG